MVNSRYMSFDGQNPYEGFHRYCQITRKFDKLVSQYKQEHNVSRLTKKTMDKLLKLAYSAD